VADKALIEVGGEAMLSRVVRTLLAHSRIQHVVVLGDPKLGRPAADGRVSFEEAGASIAETLEAALKRHGGPFLLTTADNPLLDAATIDAFLAGAEGADLAAGMVERRVLLSAYPGSRRTWLPFRGGAYSGANLFWLAGPQVLGVLDVWRRVEQQRKRSRAVLGAFGPLLLAGIALRLLTVQQAAARVGRRFGIVARAVVLPFAEACIDVDKPADHALVEAILRGRRS
jgi:GTP:adenosylcobinamide-phosphate guanylyltransferase